MYTRITSNQTVLSGAMARRIATGFKKIKVHKFLNAHLRIGVQVLTICALGLAFIEPAEAQQREIINQSFETLIPTNTQTHGQAFPPSTQYSIAADQYVPGWTSSNGYIEVWRSGFQSTPAANGNYFVELNPTTKISLSQEVCLYNGEDLSWSFQHRARSGISLNPQTVKYEVLAADGSTYELATQSTAQNAGWVTNSGSKTYTDPTWIFEFGNERPCPRHGDK